MLVVGMGYKVNFTKASVPLNFYSNKNNLIYLQLTKLAAPLNTTLYTYREEEDYWRIKRLNGSGDSWVGPHGHFLQDKCNTSY